MPIAGASSLGPPEDDGLYGRETEVAVIAALLERASAAESGVLVVRGAPGIGKSALIAAAASRVEDLRVLHAAGAEPESHVPFAGLHQLLSPVLALTAQLPVAQASALRRALGLAPAGRPPQVVLGAGVLTLLGLVAGEQPLLCVVDNAHWLDVWSLEALVFAARRLQDASILLLFATRDPEPSQLSGLPGLDVGGLGSEASAQLLSRGIDRPLAANVRERLIEDAGGNPLALIELPQAISADQLAGREPLVDPLPLTERLAGVFQSLLDSQSAATRLLLLVVAADTTGDPAVVLPAARMLGIGPEEIEAAEAAGLLRLGETHVELRQPLVRSAAYHGAPFVRRQAVHRALADVLTNDRYRDRRAWHRAAATTGWDEEIATELEQSAESARQQGGYDAAARAMARAATLTADDARRAPRALAAAQLAWRAGHLRLASALLGSARSDAIDPILRLEVERLRASIEFAGGSSVLAYEILLAAASAAEEIDPPRAAAILLDAMAVSVYGGDEHSLGELGRRAERLRAAEGPECFELAVCAGLGQLWAGDAGRGKVLLEQAIGESETARNPRRLFWAAVCALHLGDSGQALAFTMRDANLARDEGIGEHLTSALLHVAFVELIEGWLDAAARSAAEGLALARQLGLEHAVYAQHALHAWIAALRGRSDEVEKHAAAAIGPSAREYAWPAVVSRIALGELALGYGHSLEALTHFQELSATTWATPPYLRIRAAPGLIEAAVRTGQPELATAALAAFEQWATSTGSRTDQAVLARCRALHAGDDDGGRRFEEALRLHADVIRPFDRARTELLYGESLRRAGRRSQAREHLRLASRLFSHLGAASWATRAEAELRASGETLRARTEATAMDLTHQELQIARLVATGATNKAVAAQLFLSPRTVDAHLRTVFRKLGISSRRELSGFRLGDPD